MSGGAWENYKWSIYRICEILLVSDRMCYEVLLYNVIVKTLKHERDMNFVVEIRKSNLLAERI
jgi:hypothetical protein